MWLQDLRIAIRSLARAPAFTALAAGVLGLGLGVVVLMYGVLNTTMFRDPPVEEVERVVGLRVTDLAYGAVDNDVALPTLEAWRREATSFESLAGYYGGTAIVSGEGVAERYDGGFVRGPYFEVVRQRALLGRTFAAADHQPGANGTVVLSNRFWRERYGADPNVLGRAIRVNGERMTVIGVMPEQVFELPTYTSFWIADRVDPATTPASEAATYVGIARLKPGVSLDAAQAELEAIQKRYGERDPTAAGIVPDVRSIAMDFMGRDDAQLFYTLFGSVTLVLLIACVNVAGLLLVRGTARSQEAGVRRALGAGRWRLASQMFAESIVITALATLLGLTFAALGAEALHYWLRKLATSLPPWWTFGVDLNVALFAVGAAAVSAMLAGLYPAMRVSGIDVNGVLRDGARDTGLSTGRIVRWLVVAEIALSCALLTCTGLMIRTALTVSSGDVGVPVAGVFSGRVGLTGDAYTPERQRAVIERLERDLRALPGVDAAGLVSGAPGLGAGSAQYALAGRSYASRTDYPNAKLVPASPGFFDTFRVELRAGRVLRDADRDGALPVAVVSESFATAAFPDSNPLGQRIQIEPQSDDAEWVTIVGVVENVRHDDSPFTIDRVPPTIYRPLAQAPVRFFHAVLTGPGAPASHAAALRETLRTIDPDLAAYWLRTIDEARRQEASGLTVIGAMFAVFAIVAVVLAASGIYGVLSYSVAQGAREIAIRRALGAPDGRIARAVLGRSAWQLGLGLVLGLLSAPLMAVVIGAATGGTRHDPLIYAIVVGVLASAIVVATLVPLRAALRLQPIVALRHS